MVNRKVNESRGGVLRAVSDWLRLLALIVLVGEGILVTMTLRGGSNDPLKPYYFAGVIGLLVVIVIAVLLDRYWESRRPRQLQIKNEPATLANLKGIEIGDEDIADALRGIIDGIEVAIENYKDNTFRKVIKSTIDRFYRHISNWKVGQLFVGPSDSKDFLIDLYGNAEDEVFSTSVKDFFTHWSDEFGHKIVDANVHSKATVTRVFIFNTPDDISERDKQEMRTQVDRGIRVMLFFDKKTAASFPPDVTRDFTIIDHGKIIGVTQSFGVDNNSAIWYFFNEDRAREFRSYRDTLIAQSEEFRND